MTSRRQLLGAALCGPLFLTGCGFHLRGVAHLPFKTMYLQMPVNTPLSVLVRRELLAETNVTLVDNPSEADAILEFIRESRSSDILTINDAGRAREYELMLSLEFRVSSPDGFDYMEATRLSAVREFSYAETEFLSRSREEDFLYRDMEIDLINQLMRRIAAIKPPKTDED